MDSKDARERADNLADRASRIYERQHRILQVMWVLVAIVIVGAGLAMIVFPGPVTIVVPAGLIMLAAVFGWARRLLRGSVEKGVEAKHKVDEQGTWVKVLGGVASACVAGTLVAWMLLD